MELQKWNYGFLLSLSEQETPCFRYYCLGKEIGFEMFFSICISFKCFKNNIAFISPMKHQEFAEWEWKLNRGESCFNVGLENNELKQ